ncbi:MAG: ATP synthase F1 subunit gamma [Candidatus Acidiferrales bacterium]
MPNVLDLRRRIRSVKNTQQITRAMKMVAAARMRRAQERVQNARPYSQQMRAFLSSLAARTEESDHPLLERRPVRKVLLVLVTADRGLCGAFNSNLLRVAQKYLNEHSGRETLAVAAGRKGRDFFRKRGHHMEAEHVNFFQRRVEFASARQLASQVLNLYSNRSVDAVDFIYNEFKSLLAANLKVERFLPIEPAEVSQGETAVDYIYEQPPGEILTHLLPRYLEAEVYRVLLESQAAEFAARMTAMDTATRNARDLLSALTLHLNRVRQAAITKEIIEIVSGAAAL